MPAPLCLVSWRAVRPLALLPASGASISTAARPVALPKTILADMADMAGPASTRRDNQLNAIRTKQVGSLLNVRGFD